MLVGLGINKVPALVFSRKEFSQLSHDLSLTFKSYAVNIVLFSLKVDVAIVEVGIGGAYDSTNIIR